MDEQDVPDQILLGAMDQQYFVLLGLAVWLELGDESPFLFGIDGINNPDAIKKMASDFIWDNVFRSEACTSNTKWKAWNSQLQEIWGNKSKEEWLFMQWSWQ